MIRVGFLFDESVRLSAEELAAWNFLSSLESFKPHKISFQSLDRQSAIRNLPRLLWWHLESSSQLPPASLDPGVIPALRKHVQRGGSLFLTLLAAQYVVDLGFEEARPNIISRGGWDEPNWAPDYPDIRGFATYLGHPIFKGLPGGVYTWNPSKGDRYCAAYYEGGLPSHGNIIAVDRQYIKLVESRRLICEYTVGKGRILTVGTYFFFQKQKHRFRPHLERFASNCLTYLSQPGKQNGREKTSWCFEERVVQHVQRSGGKPVEFGPAVIPTAIEKQVITRNLDSAGQTDEFYNVGGKRILIAGKERGGVSEIWCHPVRVLRNVKVAFRIGEGPTRWSQELKPQFVSTPECIKRIYTIGEARIEETIVGDTDRPCGIVHFLVRSAEPVEIIVTASTDLRLMWPLSEAATGSLDYAWDEKLRAYVITAPHARCCAIVGSATLPTELVAGQYDGFDISGQHIIGKPANEIAVGVALRYQLSKGQQSFALYVAGSNLGERETERAYRTLAKNPSLVLKKQKNHYGTLLSQFVQVESPDEGFNDAYQWALTSTDRFVAETPGLGSSLLAGHGTTERGWNGGHTNSGRPGYAWYFGRDSVWTCFALLGYGDFDNVKNVLEFLSSHQDPSGKIPHEVTTSGFAHYDAADATPLYIILMGRYFKASGDVQFVRKKFDHLARAVEYCYSTDTDNDHLIENTNVGHGWVEGGQLFPVHSEHYLASCWAKALEEASYVASAVYRNSLAKQWKTESRKVYRVIEKQFWNEQTQFYNFGKLVDGTFNEHKTLLPAVGISFGYARNERADKCLKSFASENFSAVWGTRIVGKDNPMFKPTGYHYGSVWPLFTGWASLAEFKMGRPIQGYIHAINNLRLYNKFAAGTIEEVFNGEIFEPAGVCSHQAWSESMALQPLFDGMLGFKPDAIAWNMTLRPYFPPDWNSFVMKNIPLGKQRINFTMTRETGITTFEFRLATGGPVNIRVQPYFHLGTQIREIKTRGARTNRKAAIIRDYDDCPIVTFTLRKSAVLQFIHSGGVALVPPLPHPVPGQRSKGLRVIDESWERGRYVLTLEGKPGESYPVDIIDPDSVITSVRGGRIVERVGTRLNVAVEFERAAKSDAYSSRQISFQTQL